jgi:hypothetical protein
MSVMNVKKIQHATACAKKGFSPSSYVQPLTGSVSATFANLSLKPGLDGIH